MMTSAQFCGVSRWSARGSRIGSLVMGFSLSLTGRAVGTPGSPGSAGSHDDRGPPFAMPSATIVLVLCYILCRTDLDRHRIAGRESAWADIGPAVDQAPLGGGPMWELFGDSDYQFRVVSAVRAPSGGGLEVFGLAEDGSVWQNLSTTPSIDDWTGWSLFGRRPGSGRVFRGRGHPGLVSLGVNASSDGRLRVFGAASDGGAWLNAQTWAMDGWGGGCGSASSPTGGGGSAFSRTGGRGSATRQGCARWSFRVLESR
jgi:hypothetical protein